MNAFRADKLPPLTKIMYESQQKLNKKNWEDTLKANHRQVEKLLVKVIIFDTWRNKIERKYSKSAPDLINLIIEIFMDSYISVHFACMSLYKQAHVSLRAELETALRLVYFLSHSVEFKWWRDDKGYFDAGKVWGKDYKYFTHIDEIHSFNSKLKIQLFDKIRSVYKTLSKYVHSSFPSFQTTIQGVTPAYDKYEFSKWVDRFKEVQKYVNTVLALGFAEYFKTFGATNQRKILKVIEDATYKKGLKQTLGLRIRGRV